MDYVWEDSWLKAKISIAVPKVCHSDISESHSSLMWHRLTKINLIELTWFKTREPRPFRYIRTSLGKGKRWGERKKKKIWGRKFHKTDDSGCGCGSGPPRWAGHLSGICVRFWQGAQGATLPPLFALPMPWCPQELQVKLVQGHESCASSHTCLAANCHPANEHQIVFFLITVL